jgi:hypothetical protein
MKGVAVLVGLMLAACDPMMPSPSPTEAQILHVVNVDGPEVAVVVGGQTIAIVSCGGAQEVEPGQTAPALPWNLMVHSTDGQELGSPTRVTQLPRTLLIRGRNATLGPWPMISYGPAAPPNACATRGVSASP